MIVKQKNGLIFISILLNAVNVRVIIRQLYLKRGPARPAGRLLIHLVGIVTTYCSHTKNNIINEYYKNDIDYDQYEGIHLLFLKQSKMSF
jgi:hypothetical protein